MVGNRQEFSVIAASALPNLNMFSADAAQYVFRFRYGKNASRIDNITDWALAQFRANYEVEEELRSITKDSIFSYVYGVLHDPVYREKYALNLKREFPRIPYYKEFRRWSEWGERLFSLHVNFEKGDRWPLMRRECSGNTARKSAVAPKATLKALKGDGAIQLDSDTRLEGVPNDAWNYRLGNRSALEWVLDQYKEHTPRDPTVRKLFNSYKFSDYKEEVITLLERVIRVSVETQNIVEEMRNAPNSR